MTQSLPTPSTAIADQKRDVADPTSDIRWAMIIAVSFFVLFLGWAAFARLDAATYATGTLVVSGERQSVQHRDGGVVGEIRVKEGQRVSRGQILIRLAAADVRAQERSLASQAIRLLAQRARLEAEQLGRQTIAIPPEFVALSGEDRANAELALRLQRTELKARIAVLAAQRGAIGERVLQSGEQGRGLEEQAGSANEQLRIINEQIAALEPLAAKGFVSLTRIRELERARADLKGRRGQYRAGIAQTAGSARESKLQQLEVERAFNERAAADLRNVGNGLGEILPRWAAARDQLGRTDIRSPATGSVVGLSVHTLGGVIAPGQKLLDIVPEDADVLIQARFSPDDADDLAVEQRTLIKFSGLHERTLPNLEGRLTRLSADSITDELSGSSYFTGEIRIPREQIVLIRNVRGQAFTLRPGMPAQILIPLRKRSALDYALEPLIGSFWSSFREH